MSTRRGFFAETVKRPVALLVIFVTLIVIGLISYKRIPLEMMPSGLTEPGLWVQIPNQGASAQENEEKVARVIEEQIRTLSGIKSVRSSSSDDRVSVSVNYDNEVNMDLAKAELRDRIERARPSLPDSVDRIFVWSWSNSQLPIMWLAILNPGDSDRTDFLMDTVVKRRIEAIDGISQIEIWGMLDDSIRILLDEDAVTAANLDIGDLIGRLSRDNFAEPLGEIDDGGRHFLLRTDTRFKSIEEIENFPVGDGLRISDIGRVINAKSVRNRLSRIDGEYAYFAAIRKESSANIVETAHRLQAELDALEKAPELKGDFEFVVFFNQGEFIESSLGQLQSTALWGGGFAVLILFLFLRRIRLTLCVALSIPASSLLAIAWTYFTGGTFNVMTMTGITLGVGMLVDNSVVVTENIARMRGLGHSARDSAVIGTRDVGLAVALATLTSVVVFLPLIFMSDNPFMRIMFGAIGIPLCMSLMFSLLVGLVFLPAVVARLVDPRHPRIQGYADRLSPILDVPGRIPGLLVGAARFLLHGLTVAAHRIQRVLLHAVTPLRLVLALLLLAFAFWKLQNVYEASESVSLLQRAGVPLPVDFDFTLGLIGVTSLIGALVIAFGPKRWLARPALPPARPERWIPAARSLIELVASGNRQLLSTTLQHRFLAVFVAALALASIAIPMSNMSVAAFGQGDDSGRIDIEVILEDNFTLGEAAAEFTRYEVWLEGLREELGFNHVSCRFRSNSGSLSIYWNESQSEELLKLATARIRETQPVLPGHEVRYFEEDAAEKVRRDLITFQLEGTNAKELARLGKIAKEKLSKVEGLLDISTPLEDAPDQVRVLFDSDVAQNFGVDANTALQSISWALRGFQLPRYHDEGRELPFIIEYDEARVPGLDTLRDLQVFTRDGGVPLAAFADLEFAPGTRTIHRRDGKTTLRITAKISDPTRQNELDRAGRAALATIEFPRGYQVSDEGGAQQRQEEELTEMLLALVLSVVLIFLLMGILFESFLLPFSVLFTIPYAIVGAYWSLYLTGTTMDSIGWIGIIILVGVVVNNGIVLIDRVHRLRTSGVERTKAVLDGSGHRVRPIMMTALTTICGLIPMAISDPPSGGIDYRALATCVGGGLAFSTFFTLSVVPLAYTIMDDFSQAVTRTTRWSFGGFSRFNRSHPVAAVEAQDASN